MKVDFKTKAFIKIALYFLKQISLKTRNPTDDKIVAELERIVKELEDLKLI